MTIAQPNDNPISPNKNELTSSLAKKQKPNRRQSLFVSNDGDSAQAHLELAHLPMGSTADENTKHSIDVVTSTGSSFQSQQNQYNLDTPPNIQCKTNRTVEPVQLIQHNEYEQKLPQAQRRVYSAPAIQQPLSEYYPHCPNEFNRIQQHYPQQYIPAPQQPIFHQSSGGHQFSRINPYLIYNNHQQYYYERRIFEPNFHAARRRQLHQQHTQLEHFNYDGPYVDRKNTYDYHHSGSQHQSHNPQECYIFPTDSPTLSNPSYGNRTIVSNLIRNPEPNYVAASDLNDYNNQYASVTAPQVHSASHINRLPNFGSRLSAPVMPAMSGGQFYYYYPNEATGHSVIKPRSYFEFSPSRQY